MIAFATANPSPLKLRNSLLWPSSTLSSSCRTEYKTCCRPRWTSKLAVVAGATGGVGRIVIDRLLATMKIPEDDKDKNDVNTSNQTEQITKIRALVRDSKRARTLLPVDNDTLTVHEIRNSFVAPVKMDENKMEKEKQSSEFYDDLRNDLKLGLKDASMIIICTGTTAYPTRAWRNGNTPKFVDDIFIKTLTECIDKTCVERVILVSSIGTSTKQKSKFPFLILNLFGVLDAKQRGEQHIRNSARLNNHAYSIVRVGRLVGDPQTNIGAFKQDPNPSWLDISIAKGDTLVGDLSREAAADAVVFASRWNSNANLDFSIVHAIGCSPPAEKWKQLLQKVESPNPQPSSTINLK